MGEESGEKTEEPTPHKLREARKKGQIAKGKELTGAILLLVSFYTLKSVATKMWFYMAEISRFAFEQIPNELTNSVVRMILLEVLYLFFLTIGPIFAVTFFVAIVVEALQTGFLVAFESIKPDINKINPIEGFKKFFSLKQFVELLKSVLKMAIVILILYFAIKERFYVVLQAQNLTYWQVMIYTGEVVMTSVTRIGIVYIVLAIADYFYQRYEFMKSMKMSKKEIKDEYKRLEGDPQIKQRQRDAQRQLAMGRQMGSVPGADVVVTNPTHVAVAIVYKVGQMSAPMVVAKGERLVALEIKRIAEEHYVPIVENAVLARSIFKQTKIGAEIPREHFKVIAEILAFVFNLKKKRRLR